MNLDAIDLRILEQLQTDASLSNVELAKRVHLSPSPCLARVRAPGMGVQNSWNARVSVLRGASQLPTARRTLSRRSARGLRTIVLF
mgnify:CR=1 FL=1